MLLKDCSVLQIVTLHFNIPTYGSRLTRGCAKAEWLKFGSLR